VPKIAISTLAVATLFAATGVVSAQMNQPSSGASSQGNVGPKDKDSRQRHEDNRNNAPRNGKRRREQQRYLGQDGG